VDALEVVFQGDRGLGGVSRLILQKSSPANALLGQVVDEVSGRCGRAMDDLFSQLHLLEKRVRRLARDRERLADLLAGSTRVFGEMLQDQGVHEGVVESGGFTGGGRDGKEARRGGGSLGSWPVG
jgi:hypothetical protein